jgi:hypothetical protein
MHIAASHMVPTMLALTALRLQQLAGIVMTSYVMCYIRYTEYELRPGGADIAIDGGNCSAYVAAVVDATLGSGIARQVSFRF